MFDKKTATFTHYKFNASDKGSISDNFIRDIYKDKEKNLWIGTTHGGLNLFNPGTKNLLPGFNTIMLFQHRLQSNDVYRIFEDSKHRLWVGTNGGGLDLFDVKNKVFFNITKKILKIQKAFRAMKFEPSMKIPMAIFG